MATEKKDRPWDGRSRPSNDKYKKNFNKIFNLNFYQVTYLKKISPNFIGGDSN